MHPDFTICLKSGWVVLNRGLNRDSVTGALMTNGSFVKVDSIAECSIRA